MLSVGKGPSKVRQKTSKKTEPIRPIGIFRKVEVEVYGNEGYMLSKIKKRLVQFEKDNVFQQIECNDVDFLMEIQDSLMLAMSKGYTEVIKLILNFMLGFADNMSVFSPLLEECLNNMDNTKSAHWVLGFLLGNKKTFLVNSKIVGRYLIDALQKDLSNRVIKALLSIIVSEGYNRTLECESYLRQALQLCMEKNRVSTFKGIVKLLLENKLAKKILNQEFMRECLLNYVKKGDIKTVNLLLPIITLGGNPDLQLLKDALSESIDRGNRTLSIVLFRFMLSNEFLKNIDSQTKCRYMSLCANSDYKERIDAIIPLFTSGRRMKVTGENIEVVEHVIDFLAQNNLGDMVTESVIEKYLCFLARSNNKKIDGRVLSFILSQNRVNAERFQKALERSLFIGIQGANNGYAALLLAEILDREIPNVISSQMLNRLLMICAKMRNLGVMIQLLEYGADPNYTECVYCKHGRSKNVSVLDVISEDSDMPKKLFSEMKKTLIEAGANEDIISDLSNQDGVASLGADKIDAVLGKENERPSQKEKDVSFLDIACSVFGMATSIREGKIDPTVAFILIFTSHSSSEDSYRPRRGRASFREFSEKIWLNNARYEPQYVLNGSVPVAVASDSFKEAVTATQSIANFKAASSTLRSISEDRPRSPLEYSCGKWIGLLG